MTFRRAPITGRQTTSERVLVTVVRNLPGHILLIFDLDLDVVKKYRLIKHTVCKSVLQKSQFTIQTHTEIYATEHITTPHSRVVN